jgi:hypothetical protein
VNEVEQPSETRGTRVIVARVLAFLWAIGSGIGAYALAYDGAVGCGDTCQAAAPGVDWQDTAGAWQHDWVFAAGLLGLVGAFFLLVLSLGWKTRVDTLVIAYAAQVLAVIAALGPVALS